MKKTVFLFALFMYLPFLGLAQNNIFPLPSGNVGIGTTNPSYKLHIKDPSGGAALRVERGGKSWDFSIQNTGEHLYLNNSDNTSTFFTFNKDGKFGIGTTSPNEKLHIEGNLLIDAYQTGGAQGIFFRENFTNTKKYNLSILTHHDGDNTPDALDINAYDGLYFNTGSNNRNPRMTILGNGNVGIGTTAPESKLTVVGHVNIGGEGNYRLRTRHVDGKHFQNSNVDDLYLNYNTGKHVRVGFGGKDSNLYVSGNMGIGTNNPKEKLQIGESYTFHDGGHKVIGFLYRPSGDIDMDNTKYGAEIRFDPINGVLGLGTSSSLTNGARSQLFVNKSGNVGIGTRDTKGYRLAVVGKVVAEEVKIALYNNWPDYVFEDSYKLPTLKEVEKHIEEKGHLQNIPSAKKVKKEGIQLGEMNAKLLQKIEELTLYIIEQNKKTEQLQKEVALLKEKVK